MSKEKNINFNYENSAPKDKFAHDFKKKYWSDTWLGSVSGSIGDFLSSKAFQRGLLFTLVAGGLAIPIYNKYYGHRKDTVEEYRKIFKKDEVNANAKYLLDRANQAPLEVQEKIKKDILEIGENKNVVVKNEKGQMEVAPENFSLTLKNTDDLNARLSHHLEEFERTQKENVASPTANKVK